MLRSRLLSFYIMETRKIIAPNLKQAALMASASLMLGGCGYFSEKDTDTADYKKVTSEGQHLNALRNQALLDTMEALREPRWFVSGAGVFHNCTDPAAEKTVELMEAAVPDSKAKVLCFSNMTPKQALDGMRYQFSEKDPLKSFEFPENSTVFLNGAHIYVSIQGDKTALNAEDDLAKKKALIDFAVEQNKMQRNEGEKLKADLQKESDEKASALAENAKLKEERGKLQRRVYDLMQPGGAGQTSAVVPIAPASSGIGGAPVGVGLTSPAATTNAAQNTALAQAGLIGEFISCKPKVADAPKGDLLCTPPNKEWKLGNNIGILKCNPQKTKFGEYLCGVPAEKPQSQQDTVSKTTFTVKDVDGQGGRAGVTAKELVSGGAVASKPPAPVSAPAQSQAAPVVTSPNATSNIPSAKKEEETAMSVFRSVIGGLASEVWYTATQLPQKLWQGKSEKAPEKDGNS